MAQMYTPPGMDAQANPLAVALSQWQTPPNNQGMPYFGTPNLNAGPVGGNPSAGQPPPMPLPTNSNGLPGNDDAANNGIVDRMNSAMRGGGWQQGQQGQQGPGGGVVDRFAAPVSTPPVSGLPNISPEPMIKPMPSVPTPGGSMSTAPTSPLPDPAMMAAMSGQFNQNPMGQSSRPFGFGGINNRRGF